MKKKVLSPYQRDAIIAFGIVLLAFVGVQAGLAAGLLNNSMKGLLVPILSYAIMAVSLNLTVGILGELSLGHAGFMSVGAYAGIVTVAMLAEAVPSPTLRLCLGFLVGGLCAALVGLIVGVPVLRLKGDYLAIVTLAFGQIIMNIINVLYVGFDANGLHISLLKPNFELAEGGKMIINGALGVSGVKKLSTFTIGIVLLALTLLLVLNLINSRTGRAIMAVRDNKIAAESIGIKTTSFKLLAFVLSAFFAGMAGVLYAHNFSTVAASKFDFNTSILILVFVVLGGLGNMWGSLLAVTVLYALPEFLRSFDAVKNYRMLVYAILLIVIMLFNNSELKKRLLSVFRPKKEQEPEKEGA